ncbi:putative HAD superfamily hydrolase [Polychaeton citri CBS 116435]|uniref:HAD superfamily hydrolase n=1 Tax=Polychaeton citri CBS 116435 TaxID=1314669 RepID=A0A9P4QF67_9PEZI|nr:putative HAD superfamily hydrolase [Polychaeton citri CBS 116435]
MAIPSRSLGRQFVSVSRHLAWPRVARRWEPSSAWRSFQTARPTSPKIPDFAFAFDIDGVLLRSSTPLPRAREALTYLQQHQIPFILLTNGGGKSEEERVEELSQKLDVPLDTSMFVQSHTPFAQMKELHDKTIMVAGGDFDKCQQVAQGYGFKSVVTPGDIAMAYPQIWPFAKVLTPYYQQFAKPLPKPIIPGNPADSLRIDAIFVYNDSRDWGLDAAIILDTLLSEQGILGTSSKKNGDSSLPNNGYQQDGQPHLYYSNPDLWWAASYHLPRLGQGGFREAFNGVWAAATHGATLDMTVIGKPHQPTYEFAETRLRAHRKALFGQVGLNDPLRKVYMVGDNPESDIAGANGYQSPHGSKWESLLVKTGVYQDGTKPEHKPTAIVDDVQAAVEWALQDSRWHA